MTASNPNETRAEVRLEDGDPQTFELLLPSIPASRLRAGDLCPVCGKERLDYDGLLNLSCPVCGPAVGGCFT